LLCVVCIINKKDSLLIVIMLMRSLYPITILWKILISKITFIIKEFRGMCEKVV